MADDPSKPDPAKGEPKPDPKPDADLGDGGKKALDEERKARRDAEKVAADLKAQLQKLTDADKSETEKLADRVAAAEKRAEEAEARVIRAEVAHAKRLTPAQAKRLSGSTREELEADADELIETFGVAGDKAGDDGDKPNPSGRPKEDLRGGGDPTQPASPDLRKAIAEIPR